VVPLAPARSTTGYHLSALPGCSLLGRSRRASPGDKLPWQQEISTSGINNPKLAEHTARRITEFERLIQKR
jgi:hypothetical protein